MEISKIILTSLFVVIGIILFRGIVVVKLQLEDEIKGGDKPVTLGNMFPIGGASRFSEKGNALRKRYNVFYYLLVVYSLALMAFMHSGD
jgi:hypothetical protein